VVSASGSVYCVGVNGYGQCGMPKDKLIVYDPQPVQGLSGERIVSVSLGYHHALACTEGKTLFVWGKGDRGQLGTVNTGPLPVATKVNIPAPVTAVSAGFMHSACVTGVAPFCVQ
jgi:alpha-tubulin suppressor-like RCC1 family protein